MKTSLLFRFAICATLAVATVGYSQSPARPANENWPSFRGADRTGIAPPGNDAAPLEWSDAKNVRWKVELPGRGASSVVVWGDRVYVTAFSGFGFKADEPHQEAAKLVRHLICLDRATGAERWKVAEPSAKIMEHGLSKFGLIHGFASSTPAVDESGVYVYLGRAGVFAFDHEGKRRWHAPLGHHENNWGSASSPILFEDKVIVHADPESHALLALDKATGREVWRVPTGKSDSWSTPLVVNPKSGPELVFHHSQGQSAAKIAAVNPRNGEALWECNVLKDYLCPSPIYSEGVTYWLAYNKSAAVRVGGRGDVTASHVVWTSSRGTEVCTPILHDNHLYWAHQESGVVYCVKAATGEVVYQERLDPPPGRIYASGVLVKDRIYYVSREKGTYVVAAKPQFALLAHNRLESDASNFNGTPAVSRGQLFLRSDRFLYCIGTK